MDIKACIGDLLTRGVRRYVYEHKHDSSLIIKKLVRTDIINRDQNVVEWQIWNAVKDTKYADSFCPCVAISEDLTLLVMKRADCVSWSKYKNVGKLKPNKELKRKISSMEIPILPDTLIDARPNQINNWGILDGRRVVVDYGAHANLKILDKL